MDQLEQLIRNNSDHLQNEEPHDGHFERFEMKLNGMNKTRSKRWIIYSSSIAAILVIGLFLFFPVRKADSKLTLSDVSSQYSDVEFYYISSINKQVKLLNTLNTNENNSELNDMLNNELIAYDKKYEQLCNDLKATPNDQRVIDAMIAYYQTKLDILTRILNTIKEKQQKNEHNENINI